jgi:hypothetical protein
MKTTIFKKLTIVLLLMSPALGFGQTAPNLNSAAEFAILAATGISFDGSSTTINTLDIGLYPGTSITGSYSLVGGVALTATTDPTNRLPQAKLDLLNAYNFAAAASVPAPATVAGDQGGTTLAPGIYKSTSTLLIQSGNLTLDAQGNENAVWIFQIASDFTTIGGAGGNVELINDAKANNVYWQVGSSATIGSGTAFKGNILALESITIGTGSSIDGRALARNGAVTFAGGGTMNELEESQDATVDLTITKTADPQTFSALNDEITYEIVVTNSSTVTINDIAVKDEFTQLDQTIFLDAGETVTYTTTYTITQTEMDDGFFVNFATAEAGTVSSVTAYEIVRKEGLLIYKVATPKTFNAPGQVINYDILVENIGTVTMTNIDVYDDLTGDNWLIASLGPLQSKILTTTYTITLADMDVDYVENTATAETVSPTTSVSDTEIVLNDAPPPIPFSSWTLVLAGMLIAGFVVFQYRRSTPKRA